MNIILCGLPSVGKTTVGKMLAEKLAYFFIDTDDEVVRMFAAMHGKIYTCREIAQKEGLLEFRKLEQKTILGLKYNHHCLIATGGGTVESLANIYVLQYMGNIIYLRTRPEAILERLLQSGIPPYLDANNPVGSFKKLAEKRCSLFEQTYSLVIDTDGLTPEEISEKAFEYFKKRKLLLL